MRDGPVDSLHLGVGRRGQGTACGGWLCHRPVPTGVPASWPQHWRLWQLGAPPALAGCSHASLGPGRRGQRGRGRPLVDSESVKLSEFFDLKIR